MKRTLSTRVLRTQLLLTVCAIVCASQSSTAEDVSFDQVRPVFTKFCAGCHNADDASGDFSVSTYQEMMAGGETGNALTADSSASSRIIGMMRGTIEPTMPPEGEAVPSDDEIQLVADWIDAGAVGPTGETELLTSIDVPHMESQIKLLPVTALALSTNGNVMAVGRFGTIEIVDPKTHETFITIDDLPGKVTALTFVDNDKTLIAATGVAGLFGEAILFDRTTGEAIRRFREHRDIVYAVAVSPDQKRLVTAGYDRKAVLWNLDSEDPVRTFEGHNDAIFDCDFANDGKLLVTASADATVKVWRTADGRRLDTRGEPLKEQYCVDVSPDGRWLFAAGEDSRIRKWELVVQEGAQINPLKIARFAYDTGISFLRIHPSGDYIVSAGNDGVVKIWDTETLNLRHTFEKSNATILSLVVADDLMLIGTNEGSVQQLKWPEKNLRSNQSLPSGNTPQRSDDFAAPVDVSSHPDDSVDNGTAPQQMTESEPNSSIENAQRLVAPFVATGKISPLADDGSGPDEDFYRFTASKGQRWNIFVDSKRDSATSAPLKFDSHIAVFDSGGAPVPRVLLRAVRDSYVTFRGKNSTQTDDFRLHRWEEMQLNQLLYLNGEVVRLYHYPRGPDSGFNVFPNFGKRHTMFGTTSITHALGEPCYIVEAHPPGTQLPSIGLPTFELNYENDDDGQNELGSDSRMTFTAPEDGDYLVRIRDSRGFAADSFDYALSVVHLRPRFKLMPFSQDELKVMRDSYKKIEIKIDRIDEFNGPVEVELTDLPEGVSAAGPVSIEAGNLRAFTTLLISPDAPDLAEGKPIHIVATASAEIGGKRIISSQKLGRMVLEDAPKVKLELGRDLKRETVGDLGAVPVIEIRPGQTTSATIAIIRNGYDGRINLGKEDAALNLPFGVYVDNTGLNGVLIPEGESERAFDLTAEPWVQSCERLIFFEAEEAGQPSSNSALLRVLSR